MFPQFLSDPSVPVTLKSRGSGCPDKLRADSEGPAHFGLSVLKSQGLEPACVQTETDTSYTPPPASLS